jgi:queuine tRNA-ribosyltransferase
MLGFLRAFAHRLPGDRPRYLMGVGRPIDIVRAVACGIDLFDCVLPTRNGRNACAFTEAGTVRLRNEQHKLDDGPLDTACDCSTCRQFSRAYLRHLFLVGEMLGPVLVSIHNIAYYQRLMRRIRAAIRQGVLAALVADYEARPSPCAPEDEPCSRSD